MQGGRWERRAGAALGGGGGGRVLTGGRGRAAGGVGGGVKAAYVGSGESLRESGTVLPEAGVSTRLGCPRQEAMCCPRQEAMMVFSQSARGKGENDNSLVMERLPPVPRRIQSGFIEKNKARFRSKREFSTGAGLHRGWNCWGGVSTTGHSEAPRDWLQLLPPIHPHPVVGSTGDGMTRT